MQRPTHKQKVLLAECLVLRAQEGSAQAFGQLVELWQEPLWRHAYRLTGRQDAAWDLLQESWLQMSTGIAKLRDPARFKSWAYSIVTRRALSRMRRLPREQSPGPEILEQLPAAESCADERAAAVSLLRKALQSLRREDRVLVSLRYLEDFELSELATILEIPEGTVKSRLHRIRNELRETLERNNDE